MKLTRWVLVMAAAGALACGMNPGGTARSDVAAGGPPGPSTGQEAGASNPPGPRYPATLPSDPPRVRAMGGPVNPAPRIVPVFFAGDDPATVSALAQFVGSIGSSDYWREATSEYGVGAATGSSALVLGTSDAPSSVVDDSAIQAWLAGRVDGGDPRFGSPDAQTIFALYYPPGVTVTFGGPPPAGSASCTGFSGYHQSLRLDAAHHGVELAYVVVPRCPTFDGLTGTDELTAVSSHELVEAATDPSPIANPAYSQIDPGYAYWGFWFGGTEVADLCRRRPDTYMRTGEPGFLVQRSWSNAATAAGSDPCVPTPSGEVYFDSVPELDAIRLNLQGEVLDVHAASIAVGESRAITLDLASDGPTSGPWTVDAFDTSAVSGAPRELAFSFDKPGGQNGDVIVMTVQVLRQGSYEGDPGELFIVRSSLGGQTHTWLGWVSND